MAGPRSSNGSSAFIGPRLKAGAIDRFFAKRKPANAFSAGSLIDRIPPTRPFELFRVAFSGHASSVVVDLLMTVGHLRVPAGVAVSRDPIASGGD